MSERVLCSDVMGDVRPYPTSKLFRHSIFKDDAHIDWPPANWRDIACWNCCHTFPDPPVPMVSDVERSTGAYRVYGVFCGFPCAKRYLLEHVFWTAGDKLLLLDEMAHAVFQYKGDGIVPSPPRQRLRLFGGDMDIEDFRRPGEEIQAVLRPPLVSMPEIYECVGREVFNEGRGKDSTWSVSRVAKRRSLAVWTGDEEPEQHAAMPGTLDAASSSAPAHKGLYTRYLEENPIPRESTIATGHVDYLTRAPSLSGADRPPKSFVGAEARGSSWKMPRKSRSQDDETRSTGTLKMFMKES